MKKTVKGTWKPAPHKAPMLGNGRAQMGLVAAIPIGWKILLNVGLPLVIGAGAIALTSSTVKSAVPEIPINKKNIGIAALLGGGGLAGYYLSDMLPEGYKPVGYAIAVAGIASSLYFLFKAPAVGDSAEIIPSHVVTTSERVPPWSPSQMIEVFTVFADPDQPNTGGWRRFPGDQEYEVIVRNESNQPITFFTGLELYGRGLTRIFRSPGPSNPTVGRKKVTLAPSGSPGASQAIRLTIPENYQRQNIIPLYKDLAVNFEFFRQGNDEQPFKVSESFPITYGFVPLG